MPDNVLQKDRLKALPDGTIAWASNDVPAEFYPVPDVASPRQLKVNPGKELVDSALAELDATTAGQIDENKQALASFMDQAIQFDDLADPVNGFIAVRNVSGTLAKSIDLRGLGTIYDDTMAQIGAGNVQQAIDALDQRLDDHAVAAAGYATQTDVATLSAAISALQAADLLRTLVADHAAVIRAAGVASDTKVSTEKAVRDAIALAIAELDFAGDFVGSAATYAALPAGLNGDWAILTVDDGANAAGIYVSNGTAYSLAKTIPDFVALTLAQATSAPGDAEYSEIGLSSAEIMDAWGLSRRRARVFNESGTFDFHALGYADKTAVFVRNTDNANGMAVVYGNGGTTTLKVTYANGKSSEETGQDSFNVQPSELLVMEKEGTVVRVSIFPGERVARFQTYAQANAFGALPHDGIVVIADAKEIWARLTTVNGILFPANGLPNAHWVKVGGGAGQEGATILPADNKPLPGVTHKIASNRTLDLADVPATTDTDNIYQIVVLPTFTLTADGIDYTNSASTDQLYSFRSTDQAGKLSFIGSNDASVPEIVTGPAIERIVYQRNRGSTMTFGDFQFRVPSSGNSSLQMRMGSGSMAVSNFITYWSHQQGGASEEGFGFTVTTSWRYFRTQGLTLTQHNNYQEATFQANGWLYHVGVIVGGSWQNNRFFFTRQRVEGIKGDSGRGIVKSHRSDGVTAIGGTVYTLDHIVYEYTDATFEDMGLLVSPPAVGLQTVELGAYSGASTTGQTFTLAGGRTWQNVLDEFQFVYVMVGGNNLYAHDQTAQFHVSDLASQGRDMAITGYMTHGSNGYHMRLITPSGTAKTVAINNDDTNMQVQRIKVIGVK